MAPTTPADALQVLEHAAAGDDLRALCERHGVGLLVAFGSAARAEPSPADLDLAYAAAAGERVDVLAFLDALVDLTGTDRIDLLDLDRAGVVAAARATSPCVPLFEDTDGRFAAVQLRAALRFADTRWLREAQLAALAAG